jgi:hypothetical protein
MSALNRNYLPHNNSYINQIQFRHFQNEILPQQEETQQPMINSITEDGCNNVVVVRLNNGRPKSFTTVKSYLNNNDTKDNDISESIETMDKITYNIETCI